jgi:hypothetical protein
MPIPVQQQGHFKKWLQSYLDFCGKYQFAAEHRRSLPAFIDKLKSKQQSKVQCEQAKQAIAVFYQLNNSPEGEHIDGTSPVPPETSPADTKEPEAKKGRSDPKKRAAPVEYKETNTGNTCAN